MFKPKTVLVAVDLRHEGNEAIRQADAWAREEGARLIACMVLPPLPVAPLFPAPAIDLMRMAERAAAEAALAVQDRLLTLTGRGDIDIVIPRGSPYAEILRAAERHHANLIVVAAHGSSGVRRLLLGSTAEQVVRRAGCSVLVARPSPTSKLVLAATDLSDPSLPALAAGARLAAARGAKLFALHCFEVAGVFAPGASVAPALPISLADIRARARADATAALDAALARLAVEATPIVEEGEAARVILDQGARQSAELLVIGTAGRTGLSRLLVGSVAEHVIRAAPCSTLVVRLHAAGPDRGSR